MAEKMVAQGFGDGSRGWLLIHVPHLLMWKILVVYITVYIYNKTRVAWEGLKFLTQCMGVSHHLGLSSAFLGVMKSKLFFFVYLHRFTEKVYKMVGTPCGPTPLRFGRKSSITLTCPGTCNTSVPT